jgi:hypothetical protein
MYATSLGFFKKLFNRNCSVFETEAGVAIEIHN